MSPRQQINSIATFENAVKFAGFLVTNTIGLCVLYFTLKSDIRNQDTITKKDKEFTDYRISALEDCCNGKDAKRRLAFKQSPAILPHEIEMRDE